MVSTATPSSDALDNPFEAIFDAAAVGMVETDAEGHIVRGNRAFQAIVGYGEAELAGRTLSEFTHPDDARVGAASVAEILAGTRESSESLTRCVHRDGSVVHARVTLSRVRGSHVLAVVTNVTAEWAARDAQDRLVRELNDRLRTLTALHHAVWAMQNTLLPLPTLLERIAHLLPPAFKSPADTMVRVSHDAVVAESPGYHPTRHSLSSEFATSDGSKGVIEVGSLRDDVAFIDEERELLSTLAKMLHIRIDRQLAQEQVERSQERLAVVLASTRVGFWEWDVALNEMVWSEEMSRLCGVVKNPLRGRLGDHFYLIHEDDVGAFSAAAAAAVADPARSTLDSEFRLVPLDGDARWLLARGHIFRDESGRATKVLGVVVDITDRRLLQEQFLQAQKMETAGQFASGIAHDLNNIMTVITGFCDLLETDDTISDVTRGRVGEISAAAARGNGLAQQLLTFGRKGSTSPQLLDPNDAMSRFEAFANTLAAPHCVRLRLGSDVGCIRVDPRHLDQAVMNLVVNARDAMAEAGVITITTASTDAGAVTIGVSDTGSGMDEATRRRMFEPFYTTKGAGKGTGLGLAVVRSVIDSAQGEVTVDSVPGRGTTVELHFPRVVLNRRGPA